MKKFLILFVVFFTNSAFANIYINTPNFKPYVGINAGFNVANYTIQSDLDNEFISATINAGARIGSNFGVELFFSHTSTNTLDYIYNYYTINHELYLQSFGFNIYGYYGITKEFDFFTTFGVANYHIQNTFDYFDGFTQQQENMKFNNVSTRLGIGLMYTFPGDNVSILAQYQYMPINTTFVNNMSEFSVGARYTF